MRIYVNGKELRQDLLHLETKLYPIPKADKYASVPISAPHVDGYTFSHWLAPSTQMTVISCYIDIPTDANANIWFPDSTQDTNDTPKVMAVAVYCKN